MRCLNNDGYPVSLEKGKIYEMLPGGRRDLIRVIDESGEDYLYPKERFALVTEAGATLSPEAAPQIPEHYEDVTREIRRFIEENEPLLEDASPLVLGRIFTQGARIFTTISNEVVEGTNRAAAAKRALAAAIRDASTPPRRLRELEEEEAHASRVHKARAAASNELDEFLRRVQQLLPDHGVDEQG